jgi:hypothetical protein
VEKFARCPVSLPGLGLIGAGADLGLAPAAPRAAAPDSPRPAKTDAAAAREKNRPDH